MTVISVYPVLILSICFLLKTECRVFLVETGKEPVVNKMPDKHQTLPTLTKVKRTGKNINKGEVLDETNNYNLDLKGIFGTGLPAVLPHAVNLFSGLLNPEG